LLSQNFIKLKSGYGRENVKTHNRKRIGLILALLNQLSKDQLNDTLDYVRRYSDDLVYDTLDQTFTLSSETDLKSIIY